MRDFSLVAESGGYSLVAVCGPRLWSTGSRVRGLQFLGSVVAAPGIQNTGSLVMAPGPSCSAACGILPDQGSNSCLLPLLGGFFTNEPPGKP